jgi:hypothetical protein
MNISVKICDFCETCVYENEYEIRNGEVMCIMCIEESEENEISNRSMGDIRSMEGQTRAK